MVNPPAADPDIAELDEEASEQLRPIEKHHMSLRWVAVAIAIAAMLAAGGVEIHVLCNLSNMQDLGDVVVFLAIAPIVSITVIVMFLLLGAFKPPQSPGVGSIEAARGVVRNMQGNGG